MGIEIKINPVSKPRMTQSDKWKKRPATEKYWAFKDELILKCRLNKINLDKGIIDVIFYIPMPDSWSEKKKKLKCGDKHLNKPDCDNSGVWKVAAEKYWAREGVIVFK